MTRVHLHASERIRTVRRLDFLKPMRVAATYEEHAAILELVQRGQAGEAITMLREHITDSKNEVHTITMHMLQEAKAANTVVAARVAAKLRRASPPREGAPRKASIAAN
jgi:hypothetical protein